MSGLRCFRRMIELGVRNFEELIRILYQNPALKETDVCSQRFQEEITVLDLRKQVGIVVRNDISVVVFDGSHPELPVPEHSQHGPSNALSEHSVIFQRVSFGFGNTETIVHIPHCCVAVCISRFQDACGKQT